MLSRLIAYARELLTRRRIEREADDELRFHVEMETEANRARGLSADEARQKALRDLGGVTQTRDAVRRVRTMWFDALWQDLRYSLRGLARSPGYVATTVLGLGVGLTAAIAMFSVLNTVFHGDPIGVEDRDSLARVSIGFVDSRGNTYSTSAAQFQEFRRPSPAITDMTVMSVVKVTLKHADEAASVPGAVVSGTFFQVLGTRPASGRLLTAADDRPGADTVVLGFRVWHRWFGGSPDAIGQTVFIGDRSMRIVGVAPDRFTGTGGWVASAGEDPPQAWIPISAAVDLPPGARWYAPYMTARLAPGMTRDHALADLTARTRGLVSDEIAGQQRVQVLVMDFVVGEMGENGWFLAALVTFLMTVPTLLLLLGCANVANLRLARTTARTRELAVRVALGASRGQLVRLILTEAAVLGAGTLVMSWIGTQLLIWRLGESFLNIPVRIDPTVVVFSVAMAAAVVGLSGLVPAWLVTRRATASGLKLTAQAGGVTHARLRHTLVIAQVAVSVLLLSLGSLLLRSLHTREEAVRDPGPVVMADLDLASQGYDVPRATAFASALSERLVADPRITHVGISELPFPRSRSVRVRVAGATPPRAPLAAANRVTPGWFGALGLAATTGRLFSAADSADVAVVSESLARGLAPEGSPIGMHVSVAGLGQEPVAVQVVGIVPDGSAASSRAELTSGSIYLPLPSQPPLLFSIAVRVHSSTEATTLVPDVNRVIAAAAPAMPWTRVETASAVLADRTSDSRSLAFMVSAAGLVGLLLSAAGLFAVMSYTVSLRTREIGVRVALGGRSSDLARLVLREAVRLTVFGAVIGLSLSIPLAFVMQSALYGVSPLDPLALAGTTGLLLVTAVAASGVPALRAASTSPLVALRAE